MSSNVKGDLGRVYERGEVLQRHRQDEALSIFKAQSASESFAVKRVPRHFFDLSLRLGAEFKGSRRLRLHCDHDQEEAVLVFPYFKSTLLALLQNDPEFPPSGRKKILRHVGEAIQELHDRDWVHLDVKPDNVLVNWTCDGDGNKVVSDAVLGDFDIAFQSEEGEKTRDTPYAVGNAMWRSPEGQTGRGISKSSDIFSFGLVCIYALGGGDLLILDGYQQLVDNGIAPEQEILTRHISYFGPLPKQLLEHVNNEDWSAALQEASETADQAVQDEPRLRFKQWGEELGPEAVDMISGMTNLDPKARLTINQILEHPYWEEDA